MATLYSVDGRVKEIRPSNGVNWSPEELQTLVGGYIEVVLTVDNRFMVINEQGKVMNPPLEANFPATRLYLHGRRDYIAGPAVVVDTKLELDGPDDDEE